MFDYMLLISIVLEVLIAVLFFLAANKGKKYFHGLALTFAIYVLYDLSRLLEWEVAPIVLSGGFLIATLAALYSAWHVYKRM